MNLKIEPRADRALHPQLAAVVLNQLSADVQDEQWSTGKRFFDMTAYWQWHAAQAAHDVPEGDWPQTV